MKTKSLAKTGNILRFSKKVRLTDGAQTTIHVVRYDKQAFKLRIVASKESFSLLDWCEKHEVSEAMNGGFFLREFNQLLGELWVNGKKYDSVPVESPWHKTRASLHIDSDGAITIGSHYFFDFKDKHHLIQAGPLLISQSVNQITDKSDHEGLSAAAHQFDSDITVGRYPRAAIGTDEKYIWSVVCDGRGKNDAGMTLSELSDYMLGLGIQDALNLDGGSSASQVSNMQFRNTARGLNEVFERGRPIFSAIAFEPLN